MCLYTKHAKPLVAEEDIVCYKELDYCGYGTATVKWRTPFLNEPVTDEMINGIVPLVAKGNDSLKKTESYIYVDWRGFVQSGRGDIDYNSTKEERIEELLNFKCKKILSYTAGEEVVVGGGFIHSNKDYTFSSGMYGKVFRCIIPKGTEYYIGVDGDYASRQIQFCAEANIN